MQRERDTYELRRVRRLHPRLVSLRGCARTASCGPFRRLADNALARGRAAARVWELSLAAAATVCIGPALPRHHSCMLEGYARACRDEIWPLYSASPCLSRSSTFVVGSILRGFTQPAWTANFSGSGCFYTDNSTRKGGTVNHGSRRGSRPRLPRPGRHRLPNTTYRRPPDTGGCFLACFPPNTF